ncbi:hypothetical protein N9B94_04220 [Verrucomicrobia bacterium]|nr:hypothetical protein [Verrucomicrobiota bacterium]
MKNLKVSASLIAVMLAFSGNALGSMHSRPDIVEQLKNKLEEFKISGRSAPLRN